MLTSREINKIIIHCSATKPSMTHVDADLIREWHTKERGWSDIGYHFIIKRDSIIEAGRDISKAGAHCKGHNKNSIGICLVGGMSESGKSEFNYTIDQLTSLSVLIDNILGYHDATVHGHNEFNSHKTCPNFNVKEWQNTQ